MKCIRWWCRCQKLHPFRALAIVLAMTPREMALRRWAGTTPEQRSATMRALAMRKNHISPTRRKRSWFLALVDVESRLGVLEAVLNGSTEQRSSFNPRLLER